MRYIYGTDFADSVSANCMLYMKYIIPFNLIDYIKNNML